MENTSVSTQPEPKVTSVSELFSLLKALWRALSVWVARFIGLLWVATAWLVFSIKYRAEENLFTVFFAYLPPWLGVLPLAIAGLLGLCFACWRISFLAVLTAWGLFAWSSGRLDSLIRSAPSADDRPQLRLLTYNRGQGAKDGIPAFVRKFQPDLAVFQDAGRRLSQIAALPEMAPLNNHFQEGEFIVMSRWPLSECAPFNLVWPSAKSGVYPAGVRCIVNWNGKLIVVYNVHLPTPRDLLVWYGSRGTFLYGILGLIPGTKFQARHQEYLQIWRDRVGLAVQLAEKIAKETLPVVVLGDMNSPPLGQGYRQLSKVMQDAHLAAGKGSGETFPSDSKSLIRLFSPWLRIDQVFASSVWQIRSCEVISHVRSQHLPLGVSLSLQSAN